MYLYLFRNKSEALDVFLIFKPEVEKQCGKQIKIVRSDRSGEYYGRYTETGQVKAQDRIPKREGELSFKIISKKNVPI